MRTDVMFVAEVVYGFTHGVSLHCMNQLITVTGRMIKAHRRREHREEIQLLSAGVTFTEI